LSEYTSPTKESWLCAPLIGYSRDRLITHQGDPTGKGEGAVSRALSTAVRTVSRPYGQATYKPV
jgi:hypothetical protein